MIREMPKMAQRFTNCASTLSSLPSVAPEPSSTVGVGTAGLTAGGAAGTPAGGLLGGDGGSGGTVGGWGGDGAK